MQQRLVFVNADEISRELRTHDPPHRQVDVRAARIMLERIDQCVAAGAGFMFETTLATLTYARKIRNGDDPDTQYRSSICACRRSQRPSIGYGAELRRAATVSPRKSFGGASTKAAHIWRTSINRSWISGIFGTVSKEASRWPNCKIKHETDAGYRKDRCGLEAGGIPGASRHERGAIRALLAGKAKQCVVGSWRLEARHKSAQGMNP